ncbi:MAG: efflux RND transporter periplasmic adaptor subunit [Polyangiaceae bacterium]|nr:efflux RND transporter periplasmic adaptor subunit [Polyangiaceae bacterium]
MKAPLSSFMLALALAIAGCEGPAGDQPAGQATAPGSDPHAAHRGAEAKDAGPHAAHPQAEAKDAGAPQAGGGGAAPLPSGYAAVTIEPPAAQALRLTTAPVEERELTKTIRTVGVVAPDETRTSHVHAKIRGFIEDIAVAFVGQEVRRGQVLCSIYSQEVLAAKLEFLSILDRTPARPEAGGAFEGLERRAQAQMLDAARRRLRLWDVPAAEIAAMERTREVQRTFSLLSPRAGVVLAKNALQGLFVDPAVELYLISDLSRVWVLIDVYEADAAAVGVGDEAKLSVAGIDSPIAAKAAFVAPTLDEATRTLEVRFELDNEDGKLRPGAFATAELEIELGRGLAVPETAILRTGERAIAFVVHDAHVEPREVRLGPLVGGVYRVDAGLRAGEQVATGAQFLLDSESRLRSTEQPRGAHAH